MLQRLRLTAKMDVLELERESYIYVSKEFQVLIEI